MSHYLTSAMLKQEATSQMKPANNTVEPYNWPIHEVAELHKQDFVELVKAFANLRDRQYKRDLASEIFERAEKTVALNLPSNLIRAAAIFVDHAHGFPPDGGSFFPPAWVTTTKLLPESQRGSLCCTGFKELSLVQEGELVVLTKDIDTDRLHAGMAGIVRGLAAEDEDDGGYEVEFGEPMDCISITVEVPRAALRTPRPGDLLENYRL